MVNSTVVRMMVDMVVVVEVEPLSSGVVEEVPLLQLGALVVRSIVGRKEVAYSLASSLALVVALGCSSLVGKLGSKI